MSGRKTSPEWEVTGTTSVRGHQPGERFTGELTEAERLLVGTHIQQVQPKSDEKTSREKEESQ